MKTLAIGLLSVALLAASSNAFAIYQCRDENGTVVFQDHPCAVTQKAEREIATPSAGPKGEARATHVEVPTIGDVVVRVPVGWGEEVQIGNDVLPTVVRLKAYGEGGRAELLLNLAPDATGTIASDQVIDEEVTRASQPFVQGSLQVKVGLTRMTSANGNGAYASFTVRERKPRPAFANVTTGAFSSKRIFCTFTLLADDLASENQKAGLAVVSRGIAVASKK